MRLNSKVCALGLALAFCLSTTALACHSDYFEQIFTKMQNQKLSKDQLAELMVLKKANYDKLASDDHRKGLNCSHHDQHVPTFIAAAAGVLDDSQFEAVAGKEKTEVQKLRFEVNQIKKELAEIKAMLKEIGK
ncbi:MAG: hypothetical protein ACKVX7_02795 [Planctomycetota bacterium]